jgi:hypothetical protein
MVLIEIDDCLALPSRREPAGRDQALACVVSRWRQKKYENPQSTPVAATQAHD